jgi:hypothetical protein
MGHYSSTMIVSPKGRKKGEGTHSGSIFISRTIETQYKRAGLPLRVSWSRFGGGNVGGHHRRVGSRETEDSH